MTLLTICEGLALNAGMTVPDAVVTSPSREWAEAVKMANDAGEELARRVDWGQLQESTTLTGDGTNLAHSLPADFARMNSGICMTASGAILRPLTRAEWNGLTPVVGTPRYFLLEGSTVTLWPYLANAATVTVQYQTLEWASSGQTFVADTDTALVDEGLLLKCLIVRWRRQKGMDYGDFEAEYESALRDFSGFNDRSRI